MTKRTAAAATRRRSACASGQPVCAKCRAARKLTASASTPEPTLRISFPFGERHQAGNPRIKFPNRPLPRRPTPANGLRRSHTEEGVAAVVVNGLEANGESGRLRPRTVDEDPVDAVAGDELPARSRRRARREETVHLGDSLVGPVAGRLRDVRERGGENVYRCVSGDPVRGHRIREDDLARLATSAEEVDEPGREALARRSLGSLHAPYDQRGHRDGEHEPDGDSAAARICTPEDPAGEQPRAGERKRERQEVPNAEGLRKRHEVGEPLKEGRNERDRKHRERAAEDERRPASPPRKRGEWNSHQPGNDPDAARGDETGGKAEAVADEVDAVAVVGKLEGALTRTGGVRRG